jgi:multidrug efflux pump subunit AcrA (membrane-fusion protein)
VRLVTRTARLFYLDKKELLMSPRVRNALVAAAAVLLLLFVLPWSRRTLRTPANLRPLTTVQLEAPEDAVIAESLVELGDRVQAGQPLFRLVSPAADEETARLSSERARLQGETGRARQEAQAGKVFALERQSGSVDAAIESGQAREDRLTVRSPIAGRVLTPYLRDLVGRNVPAGTVLAEIGAVDQLRAELAVTERLLDDLEPKAPVSALFKGRLAPARGTVVSISPATLAAPSTARDGAEPAAPREHPDQFVALTVFENQDGSLIPGMVGYAKIYGRRASYLARTWRVVKRWVQSVAW